MHTADPPERLLTTDEVAAMLQVKPETLAKWRTLGKGPRFTRLSHTRVRYQRADVDAYIATQREESAPRAD